MTITQMLGQSATLTLLGMGVVFAFLIILIIAMNLVKWFVIAFKLDKEEQSGSQATVAGVNQQSTDQKSIVAAIAAALKTRK